MSGPFSLENPLVKEFYEWGKAHVRPTALARDRECRFDESLWQRLAASGFFGLCVPTQWGGRGLTVREYVSAFYGLAKGGLDIPFVLSAGAHGGVGVSLVANFGSDKQRAEFLPRMAKGDLIAALCNSEETAGTDIRAIRSRLEMTDGKNGVLNAEKPMSTNLSIAGLVFLSAWCAGPGGKPVLEVLALESGPGLQQFSHSNLSGFRTGATGGLVIRDMKIDRDAHRMGREVSGMQVLKYCFALERFLIPVIIAGTLDTLIGHALDHIAKRQSFGKPLAEHQFIHEKVLSLYSAKEGITAQLWRLMTEPAVAQVGGFPADDKLLSLLKFYCVEEGFKAMWNFFEVFGGKGYLDNHFAQKMVRDLMGLKALGGTKEQQKLVIFSELMREHRPEEETKDGKSARVA